MVDFRRPGGGSRSGSGRSFDLLGFTHYWGWSRKGRWIVKRKTAQMRLSRALGRIGRWCRTHRHWPIADQQRALSQKLRGHDSYYGITGNSRALTNFHSQTQRLWKKWLNRRSRATRLDWEQFRRLLSYYPLPPPRVVHSFYRRAAKP